MSPNVAPRSRSTLRRGRNWRKWALWQSPRSVIVLVLTTDLLTFIVGGAVLANSSPHGRAAVRLLILLTLAVIFEETSRTVDRLRDRITHGVYTEIKSVWLHAGAIVM